MKIKLMNCEPLIEGLKILSSELNYEIRAEGAQLIIEAKELEKDMLIVDCKENHATISYGGGKVRFFRGVGLLFEAISNGEKEIYIEEKPLFKHNGAMFAANTNPTSVNAAKLYMRKMALMGLNEVQIYTEDNFEIDGYPYAGYARGRYTKAELKELDTYALSLGMELVACIEATAHLSYFLKWENTKHYRDTADTLLTGADDTYNFIDAMFKTINECFTSKRVNICSDEAFSLGKGAYLANNKPKKQLELFVEHINRVYEIGKKYGIKLMMASDMLFSPLMKEMNANRHPYSADVEFPEWLLESLPEDIELFYWEYSSHEEEFQDRMINKHKELKNPLIYWGGIKVWQSSCVQYRESLKCMVPALRACKKHAIDEILLTVWCDREICQAVSMPALLIYAEFDYKGFFDEESIKKRFKFLFGVDYDAFFEMEDADHLHQNDDLELASTFLLYNDPLIGLMDYHIKGTDAGAYYSKLKQNFSKYDAKGTMFEDVFDVHLKMLSILEYKADFGIRLKEAYDKDNKEELVKLEKQSSEIYERIKQYKEARYKLHMAYNKPLGYEITDTYLGAMMARFETTKKRINLYITGEIDRIEELETERLPYDYNKFGNLSEENIFYMFSFNRVLSNSLL